MISSYYPYGKIKIQSSSDDTYIRKVKGCLNRICSMARGPEFLSAISGSGHTLTIMHPAHRGNGKPGNACRRMDGQHSCTLLTQAIKYNLNDAFKKELGKAVAKAEKCGMKRDFIAKQLSEGLLPVTYKSSQNVKRPTSRVVVPGSQNMSGASIMAYHGNQAMLSMAFLDELIEGTRTLSHVSADWKKDLQRILRNFLRPGKGCNCQVFFDPDRTFACCTNDALTNRPPTIGLAHELVHGYRAMHGLYLNVTYGRKKLEEVITTGMAPYQYEKFSDNIFRTQYKGEEQKIRKNY